MLRSEERAELSRTIQADDILRFTEISGDRNPLHYDAEVAARTRFGGIGIDHEGHRQGDPGTRVEVRQPVEDADDHEHGGVHDHEQRSQEGHFETRYATSLTPDWCSRRRIGTSETTWRSP